MFPRFFTFFFLLLLGGLLFSACAPTGGGSVSTSDTLPSGEKLQASLTDAERIDLVRKRRKDLDSIRKGDYFSINNNPDEALIYYLPVAERLPDDVILQKKIGHAYYQKQDWKNAYAAYVRTPIAELNQREHDEFLGALFLDESQNNRIGELARIELGTGELDWYTMLDTCYTGIHNCIVHIQSYTGTHTEILGLQSEIKNAEKVSPDYQYRNFVVATRLYELRAFRASAILATEILKNRPDYAGVQKLLGFASSRMGNLSGAKATLLAVLERTPKDVDTIAELGNISLKMNDYATANLYFNNAILAGYTPKTALERKLAYSYSRLGDTASMLKVLAYLLSEPDVTEDDIVVAISLALQRGENLKAYVWSSNAIAMHPQSETIIAMYLTSMRTIGKGSEALQYIKSLTGSVLDSPVVELEKGILLMDAGQDAEAEVLLQKVKETDPSADFGIEAENYLTLLKNKKETESSLSSPVSTGAIWWQ